jgi:hypothetical protein
VRLATSRFFPGRPLLILGVGLLLLVQVACLPAKATGSGQNGAITTCTVARAVDHDDALVFQGPNTQTLCQGYTWEDGYVQIAGDPFVDRYGRMCTLRKSGVLMFVHSRSWVGNAFSQKMCAEFTQNGWLPTQ